MIFEILSLIAILLGVVGLTFVITVPFNGVLVRHRANYKPRRLHLSEEGDLAPPSGLSVTSFFGMFKRVHRVEGWSGLYKGLCPTIIATLALTFALSPFMDPKAIRAIGNGHVSYNVGIYRTIAYGILVTLILPPTAILTNRAITTSHKLSSFNFSRGLRVLLTERERKNPLVLYLTPGLVASQVLHNAIVICGLGYSRRHFIAPLFAARGNLGVKSLIPISIYLLTMVASMIVLTPLEVIAVRLSVQRNHSEDDFDGSEELPEYAGLEEDVIELREEEEPYLGLFDCAKKIVNEEGWRSLYRAWWLTLLIPVVG